MSHMQRSGAIKTSVSRNLIPYRQSLRSFEMDVQKEHGAILMVDIRGKIVECNKSAARLLRTPVDQLVGQLVSNVILDLPFAIDTPYYNLAYAVFHADDDFEMERFALGEDGMHIHLSITVSSVVIKGRRLILLKLKAAKLNKENFV
jgi:PAS domain-containing protein